MLFSAGLFGQSDGYPDGEFYDIIREREQHFEELLLTEDEEEFYREGGAYSEYQKWLRLWEPRIGGHGDFDFYYKVIKTYMDHNFVDGNSYKSNDDPWIELGPKRRNSLEGIGPIEFITFYEPDPTNMLCGSLEGGLFYSIDEGNSWNNSGSDLQWPYSGCKHAIFYPDDPTKWFAASSQSHGADGASGAFSGSVYDKFIQSSPIHFTGGVFRTSDAGANWEKVLDIWDLYPLFDPDAGDPVPDVALHGLIFDKKPNFQFEHDLFAATSHGLWRAQDPLGTGQEWEKMPVLAPVNFNSLYPDFQFSDLVHIHDIEYLPATNSSTLCAAVRFEGININDNSVLYVWRLMLSTDNGVTWTEINSQPAHDPDNNLYSIETSKAAPNSFFYFLDTHTHANATIQEYNVLTDTWILRAQNINNVYGSGHGFGIDQSDPSIVFISNGTRLKWFYGPQSSKTISSGHLDVEDIVSHPDVVDHPNEIWVSNHGGVSKITLDPITHQSNGWVDMSNGLGVAEVTSLASSKNTPDFLVAGLFHDFSVVTRTPYDYTSDWDPEWENIGPDRDGTDCMVSAYDPDIAYTSGHENYWERSYNTTVNSNNQSIYIGDSKTWWSVGAIDRNDHDLLYRATALPRGTTQYVDENGIIQSHLNREIEIFRSFSGGLNGNELISRFGEHDPNNDIVINDTICRYATGSSRRKDEMFNMIKVSPVNSDHLYMTYRNWDWRKHLHKNHRATDPDVEIVKSSWQWLPTPGRQLSFINGLAFDPDDENIVYVARSSTNAVGPNPENDEYGTDMVFRMDYSDLSNYPTSITAEFDCTNGEPCQDITMNLPNTFLSWDALEYEKGSDGGLYVGTSFGVYYTNNKRIATYDPNNPDDPDSGWMRLGDGFPHVLNTGLEINYVINRIRVGTYGRGVWEHDLSCPPEPADIVESATYIQDEFFEVINDITSTAEVPIGLDVKYRAGNTISLEPGFHAKTGSDFHAFIHPCNKAGNSFSYRSFQQGVDGSGSFKEPDKSQLFVYPNPTDGRFTVVVSEPEFDLIEPGKLIIYDLFGKIVHSTYMNKNNKGIDLQGLSGVYLVEYINGSDKLHAKIVIH